MNITVRLLTAFAVFVSAFAAMYDVAIAQNAPSVLQRVLKQRTTQRICSFDPVDDLLPPPVSEPINSKLSYLQEQGFTQNQDGSWVCYANDPKKQGRYYTFFKVQQIDDKLVGTSFLEGGSLMEGQEKRSLDLFMLLVEKHLNPTQGNRQSIGRYLEAFMSLVRAGKIKPSQRGYLFDQPNRGFVLYHPLKGGELQGTAITININLQKKG